MDILKEISEHAKKRVEADREKMPQRQIEEMCKAMGRGSGAFFESLKKDGLSFICEVKKASPSKGIISEEFDYMGIALEYEAAGADCISCLTEPKWFLGSDSIFESIRKKCRLPMLRKDFTVDEYQLYQARVMGADAVLLICSILSAKTLAKFLGICDDIGIDALVETHDENEIKTAVAAGAKIIGVNNRNLRDFSVDISNVERLREAVPAQCVFVAESGIRTAKDAKRIKRAGADAALIGEALMRSDDKAATLKIFKEA